MTISAWSNWVYDDKKRMPVFLLTQDSYALDLTIDDKNLDLPAGTT
jgi:hypothetical protein